MTAIDPTPDHPSPDHPMPDHPMPVAPVAVAPTPVDLAAAAAALPDAWSSRLLGHVGSAAVKVLRMDGQPLAIEHHPTAEALLVLDGRARTRRGRRRNHRRPGRPGLGPRRSAARRPPRQPRHTGHRRGARGMTPGHRPAERRDAMPTAQQWIDSLGLEPHVEGGYFRRTYQADHRPTVRTPAANGSP
ncbi:cupin domain-containing protein [Kitasatospora arboriphila]